jgi:hypothetical protein
MFDSRHVRLFGVGLVLLVVGYIALGTGPVSNPVSLSFAPVVLVGVYCVFFPLAIVFGTRKGASESVRQQAGGASGKEPTGV